MFINDFVNNNKIFDFWNENKENIIFSLFGYYIEFYNGDQILENSFSSGQIKLLSINKYLEKEERFYFLDEPEMSLDSNTITKNIFYKINKKISRGKYIFIATHNHNIALLSMANNIILKQNNNGKYLMFQGRSYQKYLFNVNSKDKIKLDDYFVNLFEGGKKMFDDRGKIYDEKYWK